MGLRLVPRSLFGRMVLILIGGLLAAQLLSLVVNLAERDRLILRAGGMRTAQRIGDIVELLDPLSPAERRRIVAVLNAPPLRVSLDIPPMEPAASLPEDTHTAMFVGTLRAAVGERPLRVVRIEPARGLRAFRAGGEPGPPRGGGMGMGMGRGAGGMAVVSQVRFGDGDWVTFDSTLPLQPADLPRRLLLTLLILSAAVILVSLIAVRWVTRPLHLLASAAENLGRDIRRPPLNEDGPSEVSQAARAFNRMQASLQRYLDDRLRVLAAISHDLKTPITRMRLRAEMLDDEDARARFEKDLSEMESMVGEALEFLRGEGGTEDSRPIDIDALLESLQADEQELGHTVRIEGAAAAPFVGRSQQLKRCLTNLIANAIRYGGQASIRVEDTAELLTLRVLDEGPGIAENELERVFEPFYRIEASRSRGTGGSGLGLGIARNIARAHGGALVLRNRPTGGLEAVLTLPRRSAAPASA